MTGPWIERWLAQAPPAVVVEARDSYPGPLDPFGGVSLATVRDALRFDRERRMSLALVMERGRAR